MAGKQKENTLGEWSDGDDEWVWGIDKNALWEWSDSDDDEIIRNIEENVQTGRGENVKVTRRMRTRVLHQHYREKTIM